MKKVSESSLKTGPLSGKNDLKVQYDILYQFLSFLSFIESLILLFPGILVSITVKILLKS